MMTVILPPNRRRLKPSPASGESPVRPGPPATPATRSRPRPRRSQDRALPSPLQPRNAASAAPPARAAYSSVTARWLQPASTSRWYRCDRCAWKTFSPFRSRRRNVKLVSKTNGHTSRTPAIASRGVVVRADDRQRRKDEAEKGAAHVPHEDFRRRPVVRQETETRGGEQQAGPHFEATGAPREGHPPKAGHDRLASGDPIDAVHEVVRVREADDPDERKQPDSDAARHGTGVRDARECATRRRRPGRERRPKGGPGGGP